MDINRLLLRWCECHNRSAVNLITMGYFLNDFGILTAYMCHVPSGRWNEGDEDIL